MLMDSTPLIKNMSEESISPVVSTISHQPMNDVLIKVEGVSKKFCRSLKRSLWYGMRDLAKEVIGRQQGRYGELRPAEFWANKDISFEVKRGETVGLIGHNGAGKTTLLRMLNGLIKPDEGRIEIRGRMQALIALGAGFNPILTGRENIYVNAAVLGIPKSEIDQKFDDIINFSGIEKFIDAPVQSYSSGMVVRLGFSVAAHMEPEILLVDEVLAVGDEGFQTKCLNKIGELKKNGTSIILVSHNMHTISSFSNSVILMHEGCSEVFSDVSVGIKEYRKKCNTEEDFELQKIVTGTTDIDFNEVYFSCNELEPCGDLSIFMKYSANKNFEDVEIDLAIYSSNVQGLYFQATNKSYNKKINFFQGEHEKKIVIHNIQINNAVARIALSIWSKNRAELLFWWRIPIKMKSVDFSTGNNFLQVSF